MSCSLLKGIPLLDITASTMGNVSAAKPKLVSDSIWNDKPALIYVVRRPGCALCRLPARNYNILRPLIEGAGLNMAAIVFEEISADDFNQNYWKGNLYLDSERKFYAALGGGKERTASLFKFFFSLSAWTKYNLAAKKVEGNTKGTGTILGGLFVVNQGAAEAIMTYQEKTFGDHPSIEEVLSAVEKASGKSLDPEEKRKAIEAIESDAPSCSNKAECQ